MASDMVDTAEEQCYVGTDMVDNVSGGNRRWFVVSIAPLFVRWWFASEWARCNKKSDTHPEVQRENCFPSGANEQTWERLRYRREPLDLEGPIQRLTGEVSGGGL